jgi:hypothetical protein
MDAPERRSYDWKGIEATPEFRDLVARRRRFVVPATIFSIPLGFFGCWLGTVLSREGRAEETYHELEVRSETGLGAEQALVSH